ncbi:MAG: class I SAM-dependent methyltransferase [Candidatus Bathyarchaeota archaeon]|nr:class I SAM-dependent methyltransferase [Candidatus Bathyarchaeota archaeon]
MDQYPTDKIKNHYLDYYDPILEPYVNREVNLLELGINRGGSLMLWHDYFPKGTITGVDLLLPEGFAATERMHLFRGNQENTAFLTRVAMEVAPGGFDIIIDDASHIGEFTKTAFWHLFDNHLKPGGLYAIEDWFTGYWEDWPDGKALVTQKPQATSLKWRMLSFLNSKAKNHNVPVPSVVYGVAKKDFPSHCMGMAGFVKQLVDEQAASYFTMGSKGGASKRQSKFESLLVTPSIVFVKKRTISVDS